MSKKLVPILLGVAMVATAVPALAAECNGTQYKIPSDSKAFTCTKDPESPYCCEKSKVIITILQQEFCATASGSSGSLEFSMPAGPSSPLNDFHEYCEPKHYKKFQTDVKKGIIPSGVEHAIDKVQFEDDNYQCKQAKVHDDTLTLGPCNKVGAK